MPVRYGRFAGHGLMRHVLDVDGLAGARGLDSTEDHDRGAQQAVTRSQQVLTPQQTPQPAATRPVATTRPASQPAPALTAAAVPRVIQANQATTTVAVPTAAKTKTSSVSTPVAQPATSAALPTTGAGAATQAPAFSHASAGDDRHRRRAHSRPWSCYRCRHHDRTDLSFDPCPTSCRCEPGCCRRCRGRNSSTGGAGGDRNQATRQRSCSGSGNRGGCGRSSYGPWRSDRRRAAVRGAGDGLGVHLTRRATCRRQCTSGGQSCGRLRGPILRKPPNRPRRRPGEHTQPSRPECRCAGETTGARPVRLGAELATNQLDRGRWLLLINLR